LAKEDVVVIVGLETSSISVGS